MSGSNAEMPSLSDITAIAGWADTAPPQTTNVASAVDQNVGLGELWDVINASLTGLVSLIHQLSFWQIQAGWRENAGAAGDPIDQAEAARVLGWLKIAESLTTSLELPTAVDRIAVLRRSIGRGASWRLLGTEARVLQEAVTADLRGKLIYRYPREQAALLMRWQDDWAAARRAFPSTDTDIRAAVDCWALGHGTASVFHAMRVLEFGLAALAFDLGEETAVDTWHTVIARIEAKIRALGNSLPRGEAKSDRMQFLSEAAQAFRYFKDGWRNHVSHNRATYDVHQARVVLEHVRGFMNHLATEISERPSMGDFA